MCSRTCRRFARDWGCCFREFWWWNGSDGCVFSFTFAEDAFKRLAWEPNKVTAGVKVKRDGLGVEGEGKRVVTAWGQGEGHLTVVGVLAVVVETGGGAGGGGFE